MGKALRVESPPGSGRFVAARIPGTARGAKDDCAECCAGEPADACCQSPNRDLTILVPTDVGQKLAFVEDLTTQHSFSISRMLTERQLSGGVCTPTGVVEEWSGGASFGDLAPLASNQLFYNQFNCIPRFFRSGTPVTQDTPNEAGIRRVREFISNSGVAGGVFSGLPEGLTNMQMALNVEASIEDDQIGSEGNVRTLDVFARLQLIFRVYLDPAGVVRPWLTRGLYECFHEGIGFAYLGRFCDGFPGACADVGGFPPGCTHVIDPTPSGSAILGVGGSCNVSGAIVQPTSAPDGEFFDLQLGGTMNVGGSFDSGPPPQSGCSDRIQTSFVATSSISGRIRFQAGGLTDCGRISGFDVAAQGTPETIISAARRPTRFAPLTIERRSTRPIG